MTPDPASTATRSASMPERRRFSAAHGLLSAAVLRQRLGYMRGNILVISITSMLGMLSRGMVFPYASIYILALGGDPTQIGFVNALKPLAGLLMYPIAGYLTDHMGRVKLMTLGGFLSGAMVLLYVLAPNWQVIALAGLLQGFMVIQFPPQSALIADSLSPGDRGKGIATMNTIACALAVFSPYIAGAVLDAYGDESGMRVLYGVMMVAYLTGAAISRRFLKETAVPSQVGVDWSALPGVFKDTYGGVVAMFRELPKSVWALAVIIILGFTCNAVASSFWVVYAREQIGLTATAWGSVLLAESVLRMVLLIPAGIAVDRYGRTRFVIASLVLTMIAIPLFVVTKSPVQALAVRTACAIANAFFAPACAALMADTVPRDMRGRVMAAIGRGSVMLGPASGGTGGPGMGFLTTLPVMVGAVVGGYLYSANPIYPWLFVTIATAVSVLVSVLFLRDPKHAHV